MARGELPRQGRPLKEETRGVGNPIFIGNELGLEVGEPPGSEKESAFFFPDIGHDTANSAGSGWRSGSGVFAPVVLPGSPCGASTCFSFRGGAKTDMIAPGVHLPLVVWLRHFGAPSMASGTVRTD